MISFVALHPRGADLVGIIPAFLDRDDPRSAAAQINERYAHGGGWSPMKGWTLNRTTISYPGDSALEPIAAMYLREELIFVYPHAWVCIIQPDDSFEVARMD